MYKAETLSRVYLPDIPTAEIDDDLAQVLHSLVTNLPTIATELEEILQATNADKTLQKVKMYCSVQLVTYKKLEALNKAELRPRVGKLRPTGRMRPARAFCAAPNTFRNFYVFNLIGQGGPHLP